MNFLRLSGVDLAGMGECSRFVVSVRGGVAFWGRTGVLFGVGLV